MIYLLRSMAEHLFGGRHDGPPATRREMAQGPATRVPRYVFYVGYMRALPLVAGHAKRSIIIADSVWDDDGPFGNSGTRRSFFLEHTIDSGGELVPQP